MPDSLALARMYGPEYHSSEDYHETATADEGRPAGAIEWLTKLERGKFVDYGCGKGALLATARDLGWETYGIEFSSDVARKIQIETGAKVFSDVEPPKGFQADVLHLGDVIEHLTDLDNQMPAILRWIKPGGLLIAQGPLEAHRNLFTAALKGSRVFRANRQASMPPYHVILATSKGQRTFFDRFGLAEVEYYVFEANFPAPTKMDLAMLSSPRQTVLFALRKISQAVSSVLPGEWGNRYFYCGRLKNSN